MSLQVITQWRLDLVVVAMTSFLGMFIAVRGVARRTNGLAPGWQSWILLVSTVVVGGLIAEWIGNAARYRVRSTLETIAPIFGEYFEESGHDSIDLNTPSDDPRYLKLIEHQIDWLRRFPSINDVYTMRRLNDGRVVMLVDSETDYDHDGIFQGEREKRTSIGEPYPISEKLLMAFEGQAVFDDEPTTDRWGTWISAYVPLYDKQGKVDAVLGVDYHADNWFIVPLSQRAWVLGFSLLVSTVFIVGTISKTLLRAQINNRLNTEEELRNKAQLLEILTNVQNSYLAGAGLRELFDNLLAGALQLAKSEYGFIGEVLTSATGDPYLKTRSITNIAWNDDTRRLYDENISSGLEFHNLRTLFGAVLKSGEPLISNNPYADPRRGGLPPGHPPMSSFLGLPLKRAGQLIGMIGISNRPGGYGEEDIRFLQPLLVTCANLINEVREQSDKRITENALQETIARKAAILDTALDCIVTIDHFGRILEFNPVAERTFGYSRTQAIGHLMVDLIVPPRLRLAHTEGMKRYLVTGQSSILQRRIEVVACDAQGKEFPVELAISPIKLGDLQIFTAYIRDISERKAAEQAVRQAHDAAQLANRHKSDFLASMSHEIRTPLTAIVGYAELLCSERREHAKQAEWSRMLRANSDYLLSLVNDVLDFSKIEAGQLDIKTEPSDIVHILGEIESLFRPKAIEKMIEYKVVYEGSLPRSILTDTLRFKQIVVNLVNNAIKFTERGSVTIRCRVSKSNDGSDQLEVAVMDTGIGISPELLTRLFTPFTQGAGARQGTGLGLVISRRLARLLRGDILVESAPGQGSTFRLLLPLTTAEAADLVIPATPDSTRSIAASSRIPLLSGKRILVVDDNIHNRTIISYLIGDSQAVVDTADDGAVALRKVLDARSRGEPFDLILMDMQMPVSDGYSTTRQLRAESIDIPIVALTAYAISGDESKCLEAGCTAYLPKPVVPAQLYQVIGRLLGVPVPDASGSPSSPESSPLISTLAQDEKFAPILRQFLSKLPGLIEQITIARREGQDDKLRLIVHRLRGTAANFGFPQITDLAGQCDDLLRQSGNREQLDTILDMLQKQLQAACVDPSG